MESDTLQGAQVGLNGCLWWCLGAGCPACVDKRTKHQTAIDPQESAPISADGRILLAKEMLLRAARELELSIEGAKGARQANVAKIALQVRAAYMDLDEAEDME